MKKVSNLLVVTLVLVLGLYLATTKSVFGSSGTIQVPAYSASGTPVHVQSGVLMAGKQYKVTVSGTYDANDGITADAEYSTRPISNINWTDSVSTYESYGENLLDLYMGTDHDWGVYNSSHTYTKVVTGTGTALDFYINDIYPQNNSGFLSVTIEEINPEPEPVGPPTEKDQCKKDGWRIFNNPVFKNQGQCVSHFQSKKR